MASSIRDYAILYIRGTKVGGTIVGGGNAVLATGQHALGGPEHTGQLPIERLSTDETDTTMVARPDGAGGVEFGIDATGGLPWFNVRDYGALGDGVTNDTVAIQATIAAAVAAGGGVIYFPPGLYIISGALQDTGAFNGQLLLPNVAHSGVDHIVLTFKGALRPGFHPLYGDPVPLAAGLSVLKSTLTGASGTAACISGGNDISSSGGNNLEVNIEDLVCLGPDDPTFTFWNLSACQGGMIDQLQISTPGAYAGTPTLPTHANAYGIKLPQALFANNVKIAGLAAGGFRTGVLSGELCVFEGPLILGPSYYGIEIPLTYYPAFIVQLTATNVVRVINVSTDAPSGHKASHGLDILQYVRESAGSGSFDTEFDLYDPSNRGSGYIRWYTITAAGGGAVDTFLRSGGTGVGDQQLGAAWGGLTVKDEGVALATLAESLDFVGAGVVVTGTGKAKTVTISAGGAPTGAAGGDLSGTYPNPSVVDDSHNHTSATVPLGDTAGLIEVYPGAYSVAGDPPTVTVTSVWGISAGVPYYDAANVVAGEEAALYYNPTSDEFVLVAYGF